MDEKNVRFRLHKKGMETANGLARIIIYGDVFSSKVDPLQLGFGHPCSYSGTHYPV